VKKTKRVPDGVLDVGEYKQGRRETKEDETTEGKEITKPEKELMGKTETLKGSILDKRTNQELVTGR